MNFFKAIGRTLIERLLEHARIEVVVSFDGVDGKVIDIDVAQLRDALGTSRRASLAVILDHKTVRVIELKP